MLVLSSMLIWWFVKMRKRYTIRLWKEFGPTLTQEEKDILTRHVENRMKDDPLYEKQDILKSMVQKNVAFETLNYDKDKTVILIQHWAWYHIKRVKYKI